MDDFWSELILLAIYWVILVPLFQGKPMLMLIPTLPISVPFFIKFGCFIAILKVVLFLDGSLVLIPKLIGYF